MKEKRGRAWEGKEKAVEGGKGMGKKLKRRLHKGNSSTFEALAKLGRGRRGQGGSRPSRPLSQSPLLSRMSRIPVETRSWGCGAEGNGRGKKKKITPAARLIPACHTWAGSAGRIVRP